MAKTLVGIVTFDNLEFTKLTVRNIIATSSYPLDFYVIVGKPSDTATVEWLKSENIPYKLHDDNFGFPYSINDIYDYAWVENNYDYLILAGNDIVPYPHAVNSLIEVADSTDYSVISAMQLDVKSLVKLFPNTRQYFSTDDYIFTDFSSSPWNEYKDYSGPLVIADMQLCDIQNLCLYKRLVFDTVGYTDVNFYPAYFVDNDYARRIVNSGIKSCTINSARFFHFWSRTIKQTTGGSTGYYFENNKKYYKKKWKGDFSSERAIAPTKISSREFEIDNINKWRK